jgi:hypothetical protein
MTKHAKCFAGADREAMKKVAKKCLERPDEQHDCLISRAGIGGLLPAPAHASTATDDSR